MDATDPPIETVVPIAPPIVAVEPTEPVDAFELDGDPAIDPEAPYGRNKDGTPAKKRGRKGGDTSSRLDSVTPAPPRVKPQAPPTPNISAIVVPPSIPVDYDALGGVVANLWFNGGVMILGTEWEPDTARGEHVTVKNAFRDYFKSKSITELDPGLMLFVTLSSYALARVQKPTIQERTRSMWTWIKTKIKR